MKKLFYMMLLTGLLSQLACDSSRLDAQRPDRQEPGVEQAFQLQTFRTGEGWGYEILFENKVLIHQPHIPALPGQQRFVRKQDAEAVGQTVIQKLQAGIMPPAVTTAEVLELIESAN